MKAMIFAAGIGSRLKPWTNHHPKALALVNGKSLLQRNVQYLQQYGISDLIINVHHFADQVLQAIDAAKGWGSHITISDETGALLETGGGLKKAAGFFAPGEDFVVLNADILTDLDLHAMIALHEHTKALATLATSNRSSSRYFLFNEAQQLCGWENVTTGERKIVRVSEQLQQKAFSGLHVINSRLLPMIAQTGKFSMVDVYLSLAADNAILAFDHSGSRFIDVGKPESVAKAEVLFA
ncbi:nucleotidyltransferase family protein [Deminuibacter soli]|uniref:Nucleotidyltransferase family protein n=1 Tax=Deminuibacter soli TaxID=2291815 RepID=A0A3E1NFV7_9BACT|nr:sugar phosphate nucleotidyltransferase [Deminuibacter soli]RFM26678.1 nucleotidyltransferase family protein [Deminuibacter soli]